MAIGKIVIAGVSMILVVGVCIGLIVGIGHKSSNSEDEHDVLSTSSKYVRAICNLTDYKQQCVDSVSSIANNESATPTDFMKTAIDYTKNQVKKAFDHIGNVSTAAQNSTQKMAVEDCKDLLQFAIAELQVSFSTVGDSSLHTVKDRENELKNWLSAVISYQETCLDGLNTPELVEKMSHGLINATELTSNALAIVSAISQIFREFNITLEDFASNPNSRRLLGEPEPEGHDADNNGYPDWMSAGDRKLMASKNNANVQPNAIVAQDGSGQYKTIAAALAAYPKKGLTGRYVIYVKAGIYNEYITVTKDQVNVFMYGDGPRKTMVTGHKSFKDGITTMNTASFAAVGEGFICKSMGFQNTAGAVGHQAVALRVQSDRAAFYNCRMDGYQDTLYQQAHRQFFRNCVISGTVDFIFGDAAAVIQNSLIIVRKPDAGQKNIVTAHGRINKRETTGLVIQNCRIVPDQQLHPVVAQFPSYLGRPWKQYSRTVIMESEIGDFINPAGYMEWNGNFALDTLYYAEYGNRGGGANTAQRVKWKGYHVLTNKNDVLQFTAGPFLQGNQWLPATGFPHFLGLKTP